MAIVLTAHFLRPQVKTELIKSTGALLDVILFVAATGADIPGILIDRCHDESQSRNPCPGSAAVLPEQALAANTFIIIIGRLLNIVPIEVSYNRYPDTLKVSCPWVCTHKFSRVNSKGLFESDQPLALR